MFWCEYCQDRYDVDHFSKGSYDHLAGVEYGPTGRLKAIENLCDELTHAIAVFLSDGFHGLDETVIDQAREDLRAVYDEARKILDTRGTGQQAMSDAVPR